MADGEITPTLKLRRRAVIDHFQPEIEALYAGPERRESVEPAG
jgi:long-subunit acyl-CoA synthetase (AMP-forming)